MVLQSRKICHVHKLPISQFLKKKPLEVAQINQDLASKFLIQVNHLADYTVLDEWALPKQVQDKNLKRQGKKIPTRINPPAALLTGDPLFAFDPVAYEYVWSLQRPPLGPDLEPVFQHLPEPWKIQIPKYARHSKRVIDPWELLPLLPVGHRPLIWKSRLGVRMSYSTFIPLPTLCPPQLPLIPWDPLVPRVQEMQSRSWGTDSLMSSLNIMWFHIDHQITIPNGLHHIERDRND